MAGGSVAGRAQGIVHKKNDTGNLGEIPRGVYLMALSILPCFRFLRLMLYPFFLQGSFSLLCSTSCMCVFLYSLLSGSSNKKHSHPNIKIAGILENVFPSFSFLFFFSFFPSLFELRKQLQPAQRTPKKRKKK